MKDLLGIRSVASFAWIVLSSSIFMSASAAGAQESSVPQAGATKTRPVARIATPELVAGTTSAPSSQQTSARASQPMYDAVASAPQSNVQAEPGGTQTIPASVLGGWGSDVVATARSGDERHPTLACDSLDNLYLAVESGDAAVSARPWIAVYRSSDRGLTWTYFFNITSATYAVSHPTVAVSRGYVVVTFVNDDATTNPLRSARWPLSGGSGTAPTYTVPSPTGVLPTQVPLRTRISSNGDAGGTGALLVIAYVFGNANGTGDVYTTRSTDAGATWTTQQYLGATTVNPFAADVGLAWSSSGVFISYIGTGTHLNHLYMHRSGDLGVSWTPGVVIDDLNNAQPKMGPVIAAAGNTILVAFQESWGGTDDDIVSTYSTDGGANWTRQYVASSSPAKESLPWASHDNAGNFYISYVKGTEVQVQRGAGTPIVGNAAVVSSLSGGSRSDFTAVRGFVGGVGSSGAVCVWVGPDGGPYDTYANSYSESANPVPVLSSISPASGLKLADPFWVTFTGSGFVNGSSRVDVGGGITLYEVQVDSYTQLRANIKVNKEATTGPRLFRVVNEPPAGGYSGGVTFDVFNPAPSLTGCTPSSGNRLQSMAVTLTGSNFIDGATSADFGTGINVSSVEIKTPTQLIANITITQDAALGMRNVSVANGPPGGGTSTTQPFSIANPVPSVASYVPAILNRLQTVEMSFTGSNFISGVTKPSLGSGLVVNSTTVTSSASMTASVTVTPSATLGQRSVTLNNDPPGGGPSAAVPLNIQNPSPGITGCSPNSGERDSTLSVTITGTNFIAGVTTINFGTGITINNATVNSSTNITASITIGSSAAAGSRQVQVTNPSPGGGTVSLDGGFTVGIHSNPVPTLTGIAPAIGDRLQTLLVTFTGTNFSPGVTTVQCGPGITVDSLGIASGTSMVAKVVIAGNAATGTRQFTVTNASPGGGTSAGQMFTVYNPAPSLSGVSPSLGNRLQTMDIVVTGSKFIDGATTLNVGSGITINAVTVTSATRLSANLTIGIDAPTGLRDVRVVNVTPGGGTSGAGSFTVTNPTPTLSGIAPAQGNRLQTLDIAFTGSNFIAGVTTVDCGVGITVDTVKVVSLTNLIARVTIGAGASIGARNITVTNSSPGGGSSTSASFTVNNPEPALSLIAPSSVYQAKTVDVTLTGANFIAGVTGVEFGTGITVNTVSVTNATTLVANITVSSTALLGPRTVSVSNSGPGGGTAAVNGKFAVEVQPNPPAGLASLQPASGNRLQTLTVIFNGANFGATMTSVECGPGITVNEVSVTSSGTLRANITIAADAATGERQFTVTNVGPGGGTSPGVAFTVNNPAAVLADCTPSAASRLRTVDLVLTGSNFISGVTTLSLGTGITVNSASVIGPTSIHANVTVSADAATGLRDLTLVNAGPGGGRSGAILFSVTNPGPEVSALTPASGDRLQTMGITFTGSNFIAGATKVEVGAGITVNSVAVASSTSLTANVTIAATAATGDHMVYVVNDGPGGGSSVGSVFTVRNPVPLLTSLSVASGKRGHMYDVQCTGGNFIPGVTTLSAGPEITVNNQSVESATTLNASVTIAASATPGVHQWIISNAAPGGGNSVQRPFTVDLEAPTLSGPPDGSTGQGTSVVLNWGQVPGATAYRVQVASGAAFTSLALDDSGVASPSHMVPLIAGNTYYWRVAARVLGAWSPFSGVRSFSTVATATLNTVISFPASITNSSEYRLFSLPGVSAVSAGELIPGNSPYDWRLYRETGAPQSDPGYLVELGSASILSPGEGLWFIKKGPLTIARAVNMPQISAGGTTGIKLHSGWNIIGVPFDRPVSWSAVLAANGLSGSSSAWEYAGTFSAVSVLEPFHGYYFANTTGLDSLRIPFRSSTTAVSRSVAPGLRWKFTVVSNAGGVIGDEIEIGIREGALAGLDEFDVPKPPARFAQPNLVMARAAWDSMFTQYGGDFRPEVGAGQSWTFTLANARAGNGSIEVRGVDAVPSHYDVVLVRTDMPVPVNLRKFPVYHYADGLTLRDFRLLVGTPEFVREEIARLLPTEVALWQNYPNPFNPSTSISYVVPFAAHVRLEVYSLLGQRVSTLIDAPEDPGVKTVVWDGTDAARVPVAGGVYFYRLTVGGTSYPVKKMVLLR